MEYGPLTVAAGDRVICRHNDLRIDVDNGTRGTVRATHPDTLVLETDAGVVRELPQEYVAEHVELAYCLTGHGMQGATVEHATVVAAPGDLSRGWSYTALSRARGESQLHIEGSASSAWSREREEVADAPAKEPPTVEQILARVEVRMGERDDQDLAIRQLPYTPAAGRSDGVELTLRGDERERSAGESLDVLSEELEARRAQRAALPSRELQELRRLTDQRERINAQLQEQQERLANIPPPGRGLLGRKHDPHELERERLAGAVEGAQQQRDAVTRREQQLHRQIGDPDVVREERSGLEQRITDLQQRFDARRDTLAQQIVERPPAWALAMLGERPAEARVARTWAHALRAAAKYRVEQRIPDNVAGLGEAPRDQKARADRLRAERAIENTRRQLGRDAQRGRAARPRAIATVRVRIMTSSRRRVISSRASATPNRGGCRTNPKRPL